MDDRILLVKNKNGITEYHIGILVFATLEEAENYLAKIDLEAIANMYEEDNQYNLSHP